MARSRDMAIQPLATESSSPQSSVWDELAKALSPIEERPQVVAGIEGAQQTTRAGTSYVVLHNPVANTYLKLEPREFDLVQKMDGTPTVKALVIDYFQMPRVLAPPYVVGLVRLLRSNRFLVDPPLDAYAELHARLHKSDVGSLLARLPAPFSTTNFRCATLTDGSAVGIARGDDFASRALQCW
jgi:hypothetical protein